jgi:conjugative transfer signal peptidase TraF
MSISFFIISALIIFNLSHDLYFNIVTHSLPYGIYMRINGVPERGDFAASCLTAEIARYGIDRRYLAPGNCPTGSVMVLKMIKGVPGDHYLLKDGFLELNGRQYPIKPKDSSGRPLKIFYKQKEGILGKGQYILLSNFVSNSWDSRFWGPVGIQFLLKSYWIFDHAKILF